MAATEWRAKGVPKTAPEVKPESKSNQNVRPQDGQRDRSQTWKLELLRLKIS